MISEEDKKKILELAGKYKVSKVYLFGSNLDPEREAKDIDLAVEGIPGRLFFQFYGELFFALSKPVDLIDLREESLFNDLIRTEGVLLYG